MAHFDKYTKAQTRQVLCHDGREYSDKREHIDKERTHLNYNLQPRSDVWQFVKDKIDMSKKSGGRFNVRSIACASCVIPLPKGFAGDERLFFESAKAYLDSLFGADNCISAWVHKDERNPHLHYKFCPVEEKENSVFQFNAKKLVSRSFLRQFHKNLEKHMSKVFGYPVGILNGATTMGNLTVEQLKNQQKETERLLAENEQLRQAHKELEQEYSELMESLTTLIDEVETKKEQLEELSSSCTKLKTIINKLLADRARLADTILSDDTVSHDNDLLR